MRDGKGVLTSSNQSVFTGKFYQDKKHGKGEMVGPDKKIYLEQWKFGVLVKRELTDRQQLEPLGNLSMRSANTGLDPTRSATAQDQSSSFIDTHSINTKEKQNDVTVMIEEQPEISQWSTTDVLNWIDRSGLNKIKGVKETFEDNNVNGQQLLTLTEEELKWNNFNITSLGRRKNIIRAINFLKANACRNMNNGIFNVD